MQATETQTKTYYAKSSGLTISAIKPKIEMVDGMLRKHGEKLIEFSPRISGGGTHTDKWGQFTTSDPVLIDFLDRRVVEVGDVYTVEQYRELSTPMEAKVSQRERTIEEQNRLIADLQRQVAAQNKPVQPPTTKQS